MMYGSSLNSSVPLTYFIPDSRNVPLLWCPRGHGTGEGVPVHSLLTKIYVSYIQGIFPCLVSSVAHHGVGLGAAGLSVGDVGGVQGQGLQAGHGGQHQIQHQGDHVEL